MNFVGKILTLMSTVLLVSHSAAADARIFACEPEWASLAEELGGEKVTITSATSARQDPHFVSAKPSLLSAYRSADLVICTGASLEVGWLPLLSEKAGGQATQPGGEGYLLASEFVSLLETPGRLDRADGDVHPEGNPHLHLDPRNIELVAVELGKRLQLIDAENAAYYQKRQVAFRSAWSEAMKRWEHEGASLKELRVVVHHKSFSYLLHWIGAEEAASLEPKPGIPPTTSSLEGLLSKLRALPPRAIIRTPYEPNDASDWLAEKTGIPAIVLPYTVGGDEQSANLFGLFDRTIALLKSVAPRTAGGEHGK